MAEEGQEIRELQANEMKPDIDETIAGEEEIKCSGQECNMNKQQAQAIGSEIGIEFSIGDQKYSFEGEVVQGFGFIENSGVTEKSLKYFEENKGQLGDILSVRCSDSGHLKIFGNKNHMELHGCKCAYGGEGTRGTEEILKDLGFPDKTAETLSHKLMKFSVSVPFD